MAYKLILICCLLVIFAACGVSKKEADEAYKNGIEHLSSIKKQPDKKADALYFLLIAVKNDKYKTADNAIIITSLAADIYSNPTNLTLDDKFRLEKDIITGCKLLNEIYNADNEKEKLKCKAEIVNIIRSSLPIYSTIRAALTNKDNNLYNKFVTISNNS